MRVSVDNFQNDPLFQRIQRVVAELLTKGNVVAPVDVLVGMGLLSPEHLHNWRRGRVPYLERVINCNLTRLSRLLRICASTRMISISSPLRRYTTVMARALSNDCASAKPATQVSRQLMRHILYGQASARSIHREPSRWRRPTHCNRVRSACSWNGQ